MSKTSVVDTEKVFTTGRCSLRCSVEAAFTGLWIFAAYFWGRDVLLLLLESVRLTA